MWWHTPIVPTACQAEAGGFQVLERARYTEKANNSNSKNNRCLNKDFTESLALEEYLGQLQARSPQADCHVFLDLLSIPRARFS